MRVASFYPSNSPATRLFLFFLFFLTVAIFVDLRYLQHAATATLDDPDYFGNVWVLSWAAHALGTNPAQLLDGNIFYPAQHVLAFNEYGPILQLVFAPLFWLTGGSPNTSFWLFMTLSLSLSATSAWYATLKLTDRLSAAVVAGACFAFAPVVYGEFGRPYYAATWFWPLVALYAWRTLKEGNWRNAMLFGVCFLLNGLCSLHAVLLAGFFLLTMVAVAAFQKTLNSGRFLKLALAGAIATLLMLPSYWYHIMLALNGQLGSRISASELIAGSVDLLGCALFLQVVAVPFVLFSLLAAKQWQDSQRQALIALAWTELITGLVLSLGPILKVHGSVTFMPLPFALFALVPGVSMLRATSRFLLLANFWWALLAGCGASAFLSWAMKDRAHGAKFGTASACVVAAAIAGATIPRLPPVRAVATMEPLYAWLRSTPAETVVAEFPIDGTDGRDNALYTYGSIFHWRHLVNGYSSYNPPSYAPFTERIFATLPSAAGLQSLADLGANYLIVHAGLLPPHAVAAFKAEPNTIEKDQSLIVPLTRNAPTNATLHAAPGGTVGLRDGMKTRMSLVFFSSGGLWRNPSPNAPVQYAVTWVQMPDNKVVAESTAQLRLPPFIREGAPQTAELDLPPGPKAGSYSLIFKNPSQAQLKQFDLPVFLAPATAGQTYSARIQSERLPAQIRAALPLQLAVWVINSGSAVLPDKPSVTFNWEALAHIPALNKQSLRNWFNSFVVRQGDAYIEATWEASNGTTAAQPQAVAVSSATFQSHLIAPIYPNTKVALPLIITAPSEPGAYRVHLRLAVQARRVTSETGASATEDDTLATLTAGPIVVSEQPLFSPQPASQSTPGDTAGKQ